MTYMTRVDAGASYSKNLWLAFSKLRFAHMSLLGGIISKYCIDGDSKKPAFPQYAKLTRFWEKVPNKESFKRPIILELGWIGIKIEPLGAAPGFNASKIIYKCGCGKQHIEVEVGRLRDKGKTHFYAGKYEQRRSEKIGKILKGSPVLSEIIEVKADKIPDGYTPISEIIIEHDDYERWERIISDCLTYFYAEFQPLMPTPIELPYFHRYGIYIPGYGDRSLNEEEKIIEFDDEIEPVIKYYANIYHRLTYFVTQEEFRLDSLAGEKATPTKETASTKPMEDPFSSKHSSTYSNPSIALRIGDAVTRLNMGKGTSAVKALKRSIKDNHPALAISVPGRKGYYWFNRDFRSEFSKLPADVSF